MYKSKIICILNSLMLKCVVLQHIFIMVILGFLIWLRKGNTLLIPRGKWLVSVIKLLITLCVSGDMIVCVCCCFSERSCKNVVMGGWWQRQCVKLRPKKKLYRGLSWKKTIIPPFSHTAGCVWVNVIYFFSSLLATVLSRHTFTSLLTTNQCVPVTFVQGCLRQIFSIKFMNAKRKKKIVKEKQLSFLNLLLKLCTL